MTAEMAPTLAWLGIGLLIYFFYSRHNSEFARQTR